MMQMHAFFGLRHRHGNERLHGKSHMDDSHEPDSSDTVKDEYRVVDEENGKLYLNWWESLSYKSSPEKLKALYLDELQMMTVVQSLIISFTYPILFQEFNATASTSLKDAFNFCVNTSFLAAMW
jgi:hypothetical protein